MPRCLTRSRWAQSLFWSWGLWPAARFGTGLYAYGSSPDLDALFQQQAAERERATGETLLHRMQFLMHERVMHALLLERAALHGVGPRVEEPAIGRILLAPLLAPLRRCASNAHNPGRQPEATSDKATLGPRLWHDVSESKVGQASALALLMTAILLVVGVLTGMLVRPCLGT